VSDRKPIEPEASWIFIPLGDEGERELAKLEQSAEEARNPPKPN
jgi:hypothetical protein